MEQTMSEKTVVNQTGVSLIIGDITELEVDAFVFYAEHSLKVGTGFGTAISTRGGPSIQKELNELAPLATCAVVVTEAGRLKANHIVHAVGPRFQEEDIEGKLRTTVTNSLKAADDNQIKKLAMPAMGAGFYGIPLPDCARVMVETVKEYLEGNTGIVELTLCVLDSREYGPFKAALAKLA
jgi:O-acetyl-ADP-ribose deacetylase (regulator of RNase III)